jgi:hypothetical protein
MNTDPGQSHDDPGDDSLGYADVVRLIKFGLDHLLVNLEALESENEELRRRLGEVSA